MRRAKYVYLELDSLRHLRRQLVVLPVIREAWAPYWLEFDEVLPTGCVRRGVFGKQVELSFLDEVVMWRPPRWDSHWHSMFFKDVKKFRVEVS